MKHHQTSIPNKVTSLQVVYMLLDEMHASQVLDSHLKGFEHLKRDKCKLIMVGISTESTRRNK